MRPDLTVLAELDQINAVSSEDGVEDDGLEAYDHNLFVAEAGLIPSDFCEKYEIAAFSPAAGQLWLDLRDPAVVEELRYRLARWLIAHHKDDLDFSDLISRDKMLTQHIAAIAIDSGLAGIVYFSRPHLGFTAWALFEGTLLQHNATRIQILPNDPDLATVVGAYHLRYPKDFRNPPVRDPDLLVTEGVVCGAEIT